jgi:single-strand DNA-binding protein
MLNIVAIMGRLVRDPELRTTQQGTSVCSFRIACDRNYTPKGQQREADFVDIVAWGKTAEFICKFFQKGSMIAIEGNLQTRQYQDKQGSNRTAVEVLANQISFAGPKAVEKPAVRDFDQQTKNYTNEAKAAQNAPQGQQYAQGDADDFIDVTDDGDLPF